MLSEMMSHRMERGLAPRALRMPISWVRSFTVMSMMLLTPTMPLSRVKMPITQMAVVRMPIACCDWMYWRMRLPIHTAPMSSGSNRWRWESMRR